MAGKRNTILRLRIERPDLSIREIARLAEVSKTYVHKVVTRYERSVSIRLYPTDYERLMQLAEREGVNVEDMARGLLTDALIS